MSDDLEANDVSLSIRAIKNIGHSSTKHGRISKDAALRVGYQEQNRIQEKFRLAEILAEKAGRKTIKEEDIRTVEMMLSADLPE
jgi:histone H3/H4